MDKRTKVLGSAFGVIIGAWFFASTVYPAWIEPFVAIDLTIVEIEKEKLEAGEERVRDAKERYRAIVERNGSYDIREVTNMVTDRLNTLIEKHKLTEANVTPSRPSSDRKTGLKKQLITINATGTFESAVLFLRDVSELPQLVRVLNPTIYPASGSRRERRKRGDPEIVTLRVPVQLMVLPPKRIVGRKLRLVYIEQPDKIVRHEGRDYAGIWGGTPLSRYVEYKPLVVKAKKALVSVDKGKRAYVEVTVTGGDGDYSFNWEPSSGLERPTSPKSRVDTDDPGNRTYRVTVTDGDGKTQSAAVNVAIKSKKLPPPMLTDAKPPPKPRDTGPKRWKDRKKMQYSMSLIHSEGSQRFSEAQIHNNKRRQTEYYAEGDDFDGGRLEYVHQTGALVLRGTEYFVYPIGATLDDDIRLDDALDYPKIQRAAEQFKARDKAQSDAEAARKAADEAKAAEARNAAEVAKNAETGTAAGPSKIAEKPKAGEAAKAASAPPKDIPKTGDAAAGSVAKPSPAKPESGSSRTPSPPDRAAPATGRNAKARSQSKRPPTRRPAQRRPTPRRRPGNTGKPQRGKP